MQQTKVGSPGGGAAAATNPFLSSPVAAQANIVDLFGGGGGATGGGGIAGNAKQLGESVQPAASTKASEDLLQLGNPFADMFGGAAPAPSGLGQPDAAAAGNGLWSMKTGKPERHKAPEET